MHHFYLSRPITISSQGRKITFKASEDAKPRPEAIYWANYREMMLVRDAVASTYPDSDPKNILHPYKPADILRLPSMPHLLGMRAWVNRMDQAPRDLLAMQLRGLRTTRPEVQHFRLLIVNAFGSNLGDNLIGLTAFRQVLEVLRTHLPEVTVDVAPGWLRGKLLAELFRGIDGIGTVRTEAMSVADLGHYHGLFDTGGLIDLPRFGRMPIVDWYLWWMGLDPAAVSPQDKRNTLAIDPQDRALIEAHLPPQGTRIAINPLASVPLRSLPEEATHRLVEKILADWPDAQVIPTQPLDSTHPRVHHIAGIINNPSRLAALVSAVDGLIGVNTFTSHLADAFSTPAVTLEAALPRDLWPYYPFVETVFVPDAKQLPGWRRMKVSPEAWQGMANDYALAWASFDPTQAIEALRLTMKKKGDSAIHDTSSGQNSWPAMPRIPLSWGEVFDKLTILEIKKDRMTDQHQRVHVAHELREIVAVIGDRKRFPATLSELVHTLKEINRALWDTEEGKRECERCSSFGQDFVALSRQVYLGNDRRAAVKRRISELLGSSLIEEKSHLTASADAGLR